MDNNRVTAEQKKILKEYVTYKDGNSNGPWTCTKCSYKGKGRPRRIMAHLLWIKREGAKPCPAMKESWEREELAIRLGLRNQIVIPEEEAFSVGALLEDNYNGVQETNEVDSEMINTTHQGLPSQLDSTQVSSLQGGMEMGMGDPLPTTTPVLVNFDRLNDQHTPPLTDEVGIYVSTLRNALDSEWVSGVGLGDEPPPPCPPGFDSDLWKFYLELDNGNLSLRRFGMYEDCMSSTDEKERRALLACLASVCFEVRNRVTSAAPYTNREILHEETSRLFTSRVWDCILELLHGRVDRVGGIEKEIRGETEQGVQVLGMKRNRDMYRWLGYASSLRSDVDDLNLDALKACKSPQEISQLLTRANELIKRADILIETGTSLLKPALPKDHFSLSCRSQRPNQMTPGQLPQQV